VADIAPVRLTLDFLGGYAVSEGVFEPEQEVWVAGQQACRHVGTVTGGSVATGLIWEPDGSLGHVHSVSQGVTHVALSMLRDDQHVLIRWHVPTVEREAYRSAEAHFFGAISSA
jgi:hypothetical protein